MKTIYRSYSNDEIIIKEFEELENKGEKKDVKV